VFAQNFIDRSTDVSRTSRIWAIWHEPTKLRFDSATTGGGLERRRRVEEGEDALVGNVVIELQGGAARETFCSAIAPCGFAISTGEELTVCRRP
jgi:hypothetical protein